MGIEKERFVDRVSDEFICAICLDVFSDPVQLTQCKHGFCRTCVQQLPSSATCPLCQASFNGAFVECDRMAKNFLKGLKVICRHWRKGCRDILTVEAEEAHQRECQYQSRQELSNGNPEFSASGGGAAVECRNECYVFGNVKLPHDCIEFLKGQLMQTLEIQRDCQKIAEEDANNFTKLQDENLTLQMMAAESTSQLDQVRSNLLEKDSDLELKDVRIQAMEEEIAKQHQHFLQMEQNVTQLQQEIMNRDEQVEKLQERVTSVVDENECLQAEIKVVRSDLQEARIKIAEKDEVVLKVQMQLRGKEEKLECTKGGSGSKSWRPKFSYPLWLLLARLFLPLMLAALWLQSAF